MKNPCRTRHGSPPPAHQRHPTPSTGTPNRFISRRTPPPHLPSTGTPTSVHSSTNERPFATALLDSWHAPRAMPRPRYTSTYANHTQVRSNFHATVLHNSLSSINIIPLHSLPFTYPGTTTPSWPISQSPSPHREHPSPCAFSPTAPNPPFTVLFVPFPPRFLPSVTSKLPAPLLFFLSILLILSMWRRYKTHFPSMSNFHAPVALSRRMHIFSDHRPSFRPLPPVPYSPPSWQDVSPPLTILLTSYHLHQLALLRPFLATLVNPVPPSSG